MHITVVGLHLKSPRSPGGFTDSVQHVPLSEEAVDKSVLELVGAHNVELPNFEDGYREWRKDFDGGGGGVFTVAVADVLAFIEEALSTPPVS